jgi:hypothetical protein
VGRFTPFGVGTDVPGAVASLTLPQLLGPIKNAGGVDWKWQPLKDARVQGPPFYAVAEGAAGVGDGR